MFLPMLAGNCRDCIRTPSPPTGGILCLVGQRERKMERGRQVDVSAHGGRELQRLYKETLTTYRRYTLWKAREKGKWKWRGRQVDVSAHGGRELQRFTRKPSPPTGGILCGRPERKESGEWKHR